MSEESKEKVFVKQDEEKSIITGAMEKIGILEKEVQEEREEKKSLNQRIEDLVNQIEKVNKVVKKEFSFKRIFLRGLLQGLGIVIGSTLLAGILYSLAVKLGWKEIIQENTLKYVLEQEEK